MSGRVLLVRHPPVARRWAGRCYGRSDMGWSREGAAMARALVGTLAAEPLAAIVHSGLGRTRRLAEAVARRRPGCVPVSDPRWAERDFGGWEGRTWQAIWRETGDAMDGMMTDPAGYRPGGGETGAELSARVAAGWAALPAGPVLVVAHGGSIAALRCALAGDPLEAMARHIVACGTVIAVERP